MPQIGDVVKGKVVKIYPKKAFVELENKDKAVLHISQISTKYVRKIEDHVTLGQVVEARIVNFNRFKEWELSITLLADEEKFKKERFDEQMKHFLKESAVKQQQIQKSRDRKHGIKIHSNKNKNKNNNNNNN